ncbi:MAG: MBL fold metallo-hydrolase [Oscillospiraceae bacterium]|nr:MBL fold metallo-hydrolase [Oscillospiraceae bacterium]
MFLCTLASGSSGNCAVVSDGTHHFLIDAGISARRIQKGLAEIGLKKEDLSGIFITHTHTDHISGLSVFLKKSAIPVYTSKKTGETLIKQIPVPHNQIHTFQPDEPFDLFDWQIFPFSTWHDVPGSVGYRLTAGEASVAVVTDLGHVTKQVADGIEGAEMLLLEANYDLDMLRMGSYPAFLKRRIESNYGHLSNSDAARTAAWAFQNGTKTILLGHLSAENNRPECALKTVGEELDRFAGRICLEAVPRSTASRIYAAGESNVEYTSSLCGKTKRDVLCAGGPGISETAGFIL